jgi:hypothetical protein
VRARAGGVWLGFDRAAVTQTDDGRGSRLACVVAVPASTFAGAHLVGRLEGAWVDEGRLVVVARLAEAPEPVPGLARLAAGCGDDAAWLGPEEAVAEVRRARRRFRERRAYARVLGGRAWVAHGLRVEDARFTTPHSLAEYRIDRLPRRYVRGLEGLLDDDERLLYLVERPEVVDQGLVERLARRKDRRAALLALTDRQLLWIVDHADPDRHLLDWGVDVETVPLERLTGTRLVVAAGAHVEVTTDGGPRSFGLPAELLPECEVLERLLRRFVGRPGETRPRRVYEIPTVEPDARTLDAFGQVDAARAALEVAGRDEPVMAAFFDPRRPGVRRPSLLLLRKDAVELRSGDTVRVAPLDGVAALRLTLSALVGRVTVVGTGESIDLRFPAPLSTGVAAWVGSARRALANR